MYCKDKECENVYLDMLILVDAYTCELDGTHMRCVLYGSIHQQTIKFPMRAR